MYVDEQTYLAHYGVKGMKWGVRKKDNLAVRGVQRIGRTMASGPFGKAGIKAGKKINEVNAKRSKRASEAKANLSNVKKSAKEVRAIKKSRKAEKKAAKERDLKLKSEAGRLTDQYVRDVIEPKLAKKYGHKNINDLSDFELGNYAFDFEEMESAYYNKTLSELRRKR